MPESDHKTDAELLIEFSRSGNHAAFAALVKRHGGMVHGVAMRVLNNHHDAQDVSQAVFLVLARESGNLGRNPSVAGWLHTASRRAALDVLRSRQSRQRREQDTMNDAQTVTPDATLRAGFRRELDAALGSLPEHYRQPLVLFHLEGATLEEVSSRLALNPSTLRTRLARARDMLQRALERRGVAITSVGAMATLFAAEAKAAACSPAVLSALLETAAGGGTPLSARVLEIAGNARGATTTNLSTTLTTLSVLMKTKAALVTAVVIALAAVGTTVHIVNRNAGGSAIKPSPPGSGVRVSDDRSRPGQRPAPLSHSKISSEEEFPSLMESVLLIGNDSERLAAIREKLGMDISEAVYRRALEAYGYRIDPEKLLGHLCQEWLAEDPLAATRWPQRLPGRLKERFTRGMASWWLAIDEAAATAWAEKNLTPGQFAEARMTADSHRSTEEAGPSADNLRQIRERIQAITGDDIPSEKARKDLMEEFGTTFADWAERDPRKAIEFWTTLDEDARKHLPGIKSAFADWARVDPDAALERAKALMDPEERADALLGVLPAWQLKHVDRTIDQAVDLSGLSDKAYEGIVSKVVSDWSTANPAGAMDFAIKVEDPVTRNKLVGEVVESWARKDANAAREWVTAMPAGKIRDTGLSEISERLSGTDFAAAAGLIKEIGDRGLKYNAIYQMIEARHGLRDHLPEALELAEELGSIHSDTLQHWAAHVTPDNARAFRNWLEKANTEGLVTYDTHPNPKQADPAEVLDYNRRVAEEGFKRILNGLKEGE
jgi:RNA polymerase sigma factor (sigma-70 family)